MELEKSQLSIFIDKQFVEPFFSLDLVLEGKINQNLQEKFQAQIEKKIFEAKIGQTLQDDINRKFYLGLGILEELTVEKIAQYFIKLGEKIRNLKGSPVSIFIPKIFSDTFPNQILFYQMANSLELGFYSLRKLIHQDKENEGHLFETEISFVLEDTSKKEEALKGIEKSKIVAPYINETRIIEHLPANHFTPENFVERSIQIAKQENLKCRVFEEKELKENGLNGILSVCNGSNKKAKMIILKYKPKNPTTKKTLAIVGKGITFDSGGISLKPSGSMHEMKYDMCGASVALHAIGAAASLNLSMDIIAAIGVAENMPSSSAVKPGDVYTAYNGLTVEVQNTDAEGRLVLGDVLSYVCKNYKPDYMVDLATLTGAVIVGLGYEAAAIMGNSKNMISHLKKASETSGERVWELPFWEEYALDLKSNIADLKNITSGKGAGTITAGKFLEKFVDADVQWAHIDIAGTGWQDKPNGVQAPLVTGYGVRLLVDLVSQLEKEK